MFYITKAHKAEGCFQIRLNIHVNIEKPGLLLLLLNKEWLSHTKLCVRLCEVLSISSTHTTHTLKNLNIRHKINGYD